MKWEYDDTPLVALDTLITFQSLRSYLDLVERQMEESYRMAEAPYRQALKKAADQDEAWEVLNEKFEVDDHYEEEMKPILRYSLVVFVHISFETRSREVCDYVSDEKKLRLRSCELQGSEIERVKKFFGKLVGIEMGQWNEWSSLVKAQKVRNCIVHRNGFLDDENRHKLAPMLADPNSGLCEDHQGRLFVSKDYCQSNLANGEAFFRRLFKELGWRKS